MQTCTEESNQNREEKKATRKDGWQMIYLKRTFVTLLTLSKICGSIKLQVNKDKGYVNGINKGDEG